MVVLLKQLLGDVPLEIKDTVDRTRKRLNTAIRDGLRNHTGLLLNRPETSGTESKTTRKSVAVPVSLEPGLTFSLRDFSIDADPIIIQLSPFRSALERARNGLSSSKELMKWLQLKDRFDLIGDVDLNAPENARVLIGRLLSLLDKQDPVTKILAVNEDILGVYRYRTGRNEHGQELFEPTWDPFDGKIELYWAVIGLIARMLGVTIETLTGVVLIHELAHGYTHMGADIDNDRWASWWFCDSDHELKEGLAQYYTDILSRRLDNQLPGLHNAYQELLKRQPPAYHTHLPWLEEFRQEEVRLALIAVRRRGKATLADFNSELHRARKSLRNSNTKNRNNSD